MLGRKNRGQTEMVFAGSIADFIPDDHILMQVDKVLDLSWLRAEVADCYVHNNGRPGIDPEVAVRLMLAGLLCNIVHDRRLMREAQVNLAIRWFAGFGLTETLPDHSSLTRIRQRWGKERFARIFEKSVEACVTAKLVGGDILHVDASLIRANVSWSSLAVEYVDASIEANKTNSDKPDDDDTLGGPKGPSKSATQGKTGKPAKPKRVKRSRTDPDARMATNKYNQRMEPCFKQFTGVDTLNGVQVDVAIVRADRHEGSSVMEQVYRVEARTGKPLSIVTADRGYSSATNYAKAEAHGVRAVIPVLKTRPAKVPISRFRYDEKHDRVRCPQGRHLLPSSKTARGRNFRAKTKDCKPCDMKELCLTKSVSSRSIPISDGHSALLRARRQHVRKSDADRAVYNAHRFRVEGVHGEAKTCHGLHRAVRRGLTNMEIQAYLTAAVINLKRLAKAFCAIIYLWRRENTAVGRVHGAYRRIILIIEIAGLKRRAITNHA